MPNIDITSEQHVAYGTGSHRDEVIVPRDDRHPSQLRWRDLHPPGVRVLPRGAPPAGAGEINWENTLGGKFFVALQQLEGLMHAVFGSRPAAYNMGGTWRKVQWYDRVHPRCLWAPEMWQQRIITGYEGCTEAGQCFDYWEFGREYPALGAYPSCCPMPVPAVPVRSRSGDPAGQYGAGTHNRTIFPAGSVHRTGDDAALFDPEGFGWFGATHPGRDDAGVNPWLDEANGYVHNLGAEVAFSWQKPDAVAAPSAMRLHYRTRPPGGSWGGWTTVAMTDDGSGLYSATVAAQRHGTDCQWYFEYVAGDSIFEPGGATVPDADSAYSFQWYTHYNPYAHGLPELLDDYGGVDVRHGTDFFQFDGSESIQPGLINMARWVLSWLGGNVCDGYDSANCLDTELRGPVVHHNPRLRGTDTLCCMAMPIRFRWSGSNAHPHYATGGKGLVDGNNPLDTRPLHNHPDHHPATDSDDVWGDVGARKTWRGMAPLFYDDAVFGNPFYGEGYSWGTAPGTFPLMYKPAIETNARVYATYPGWGLRADDVIEPVHIQEIIDAVAYLIDNGVWTQRPICTRRRQPGTAAGYPCGWVLLDGTCPIVTGDCESPGCVGGGRQYEFDYYPCLTCCEPDPPCCGWFLSQYQRCGYGPSGCESFSQALWTAVPPGCETPTCVAPSKPSWSECTSDCRQEYCGITVEKNGSCTNCQSAYLVVNCDSGVGDFCGGWGSSLLCDDAHDPHVEIFGCSRTLHGWSRFVCGPPQCEPGFDANHGNLFVKARYDHGWHPGLNFKATGTPGYEGNGNCWGDTFVCGQVVPDAPDIGLWFGTVVGATWLGQASPWINGCVSASFEGSMSASPSCIGCPGPNATPPDIPGYGLYDPMSGEYVCTRKHDDVVDDWACSCNYTLCGNYVWVAVDLNVDGSARAYRNFAGRYGDLGGYDGPGIPRLRNYDLTKDPTEWMHDCPCETWTGAETCG